MYGALDRLAQFFIAPLFNPDGTDREMKAVDSEHKKNIQNDSWRLMQIGRTASNPKHPFSKFSTGCLETLSNKPEIRDILLEFHDRYYSANLMRLAIYGKDSLDQLEAWTVELFSDVPNKQASLPTWPTGELPWSPTELCTAVYAKTLKDMHVLIIAWQIEDQRKLYRTKPAAYFCHFLGHEGPGSLMSLFRSRGWATSLSAYAQMDDGFGFFEVQIELSEEGLSKHRDIIELVFGYINLLKQSGGVSFEAWEECRKLSDIGFRWREAGNPARRTSEFAKDLHVYAPEHIVCGDFVMDRFDRPSILALLDSLNVDNFRFTLACSKWQTEDFRQLSWRSEHWYGAEFCVQPLNENFLNNLRTSQPDPSLFLPPPNPFIPENFDIIVDTLPEV